MRSLGLAALAALLGAATWAAWLSWGFYPQRSYGAGQVIGCAGTALVLVVALAWFGRRVRPLLFTAWPFALGLTIAWTIWATSDDDTGMAGVGAILMLLGTSISLTIVEGLARLAIPTTRR